MEVQESRFFFLVWRNREKGTKSELPFLFCHLSHSSFLFPFFLDTRDLSQPTICEDGRGDQASLSDIPFFPPSFNQARPAKDASYVLMMV